MSDAEPTSPTGVRWRVFALACGFVEHDRYLLDGQTIPFTDLDLVVAPGDGR